MGLCLVSGAGAAAAAEGKGRTEEGDGTPQGRSRLKVNHVPHALVSSVCGVKPAQVRRQLGWLRLHLQDTVKPV